MGGFIDCQFALVPWGAKATFRRARVGLLRKGTHVYLVICVNSKIQTKLPLTPTPPNSASPSVECLPAAIRFTELAKDLFIRNPSDEQRWATMKREIQIVLKREQYSVGKQSKLDTYINKEVLQFDEVSAKELTTAPVSARLIGAACHDGGFNNNHLVDGCNSDTINISCRNDEFGRAQSERLAQRLDNQRLKNIKINGFAVLPRNLWVRSSLTELTLTDCNLTSVPKQLETFSSTLTSLDLSRNSIVELPRRFCCKMANLRFLNLNSNKLEHLPIEIKFFRRLVDLDLSNNLLRMLPTTFSDLKRLRDLNVANNNLSQLPAFRKTDIRLKQLDVSHNPLDGAMSETNIFEVHTSYHDDFGYNESVLFAATGGGDSGKSVNKVPSLFEMSMLRIVRCDRLLKQACEEQLPSTVVHIMQRDIFKCYRCSKMNMLPAYNSTDILDYVDQVEVLKSTGNYRHGMTFMKLICRLCFDDMSS